MTGAHHTPFKTLLNFAHELADQSGPVVLKQFRRRIAVDNKLTGRAFDPVTVADRGAERAIARHIARHMPQHGIVGEEYGSRNPDARYRWIVDPIDGTRSFIMGSPMWGTLIGLMDGEAPLLGVMDQPYVGERFWSSERSAYARDASGRTRRISTRTCPSLEDAIVATTHPDLFANGYEQQAFQRVKQASRMTRYGGDCYSYCLLAAGFLDVIVEAGLQGYDIVALIPIVERAGGRVTTWDGAPATAGGRIVATGDPTLHDRVLEVLAKGSPGT